MKSERIIHQINKLTGDTGEKEVVDLVPCPNCRKKLMILPPSYPLYDVQCTACSFRAQVKTQNSKPKSVVFGAGWAIMDKVTKAGYPVPPVIINFRWKQGSLSCQRIMFFPFVPKIHLKKRVLSKKHVRAGYPMFNYIRLNELPSFVLYQK